jgi:endonuclease VIII
MPEGDTIFRAARSLQRALAGKIVTRFDTALAPLASVNDNTPIAGRVIERVESRGKWLILHFSGDLMLVTHMLMSGSWHIYRPGERWRQPRSRMRAVIATADFEAVAFNVPVAQFHTARSLERNTMVPKLGPDLLSDEFSEAEARARLIAHAEDDVAEALLNQRVTAGLGNVYKSEVCFACQVNPFRKVSSLTANEIDCILDRSRKLMAANVADGAAAGIITYTGPRRTTRAANQGERLWVYARQGKECRRCGATVLMRKQGSGARSTYWCPECQPMKDAASTQTKNDTQPVQDIEGWSAPVRRRKIGCQA